MKDIVTITFDGRPLEARRGESLAAALTVHGIRTLRTTRSGAERGLFCGMGVCQDCLVEVDGRANQRACMVKIEGPMQVRTEVHLRPLPPAPPSAPRLESGPMPVERPDVLVIGGGPGGLAAAIAARRSGASVVLVDERAQLGGQYYKQVAAHGVAGPDAQHRGGAVLIETARALGIDIRPNVLVWGAFEPREFMASGGDGPVRFEPRIAIVATGAYESAWPVPDWTLPGVMTTGAAQTLWRTARRLPGRRILIAGNGPLNLQLAAELVSGGAEVVAVVEAAPKPGLAHWRSLLAMIAAAPGLVADGIRYHGRRALGRTPMIHGCVVMAVVRSAGGLDVTLGASQGGVPARRLAADVLCLGYGFEPSNEILRALGVTHDVDPLRRTLVTRRDAEGRTDVEGVFALGDCTGLGGAQAALAEGTIAGDAAAQDLGLPRAGAGRAGRAAAGRLARHRRFQRHLWTLYAPLSPLVAKATPETSICRCEEVTFAQIDAALGEGMTGIGAIKRRTRVGMGRCQGRYCAPLLAALLAERFGRGPDQFSGFAPRVPVKPVAIEDLTRLP